MSRDADIRLILTRRSSRRFLAEEVSDEDLGLIIEAGLRAPSSKNSQPWFIAIAKGHVKDQICEWVVENPERIPTKPGKLLIEEPAARPRDSTFHTLRYVRAAPVLLLLFNRAPFSGGKNRMEHDIRNGKRVSFENEYVGIGACMENILLATHALGLGAIAVMDILPAASAIKERFEIDYDLVIGVAIGHTAEKRLPPRLLDMARFVRHLE